jgi:hypothetical protein
MESNCTDDRLVCLNGTVTRMDFYDRGPMLGTIPPSLSRLTALTLLSLHGNSLSGTIPPQLGDMTTLENIDLSVNNLHGTVPSSLGRLSRLHHFFLNVNDLVGTLPSGLAISSLSKSTCYVQVTVRERNCLVCATAGVCKCDSRNCSAATTMTRTTPPTRSSVISSVFVTSSVFAMPNSTRLDNITIDTNAHDSPNFASMSAVSPATDAAALLGGIIGGIVGVVLIFALGLLIFRRRFGGSVKQRAEPQSPRNQYGVFPRSQYMNHAPLDLAPTRNHYDELTINEV